MNIIKQFGYEAAKQAAVNYKNSGDKATADRLELQCLEYRRQHNIYEVGDLVVNDAFINSYVYVFKKLLPDISMALIAYDDDEGACGLYGLRHATDAEIKAGKRL